MKPYRDIARFTWFTLAINLGVILLGAYVRASGSGAGCGSHWPLCNGEILPTAPQAQTLIEFSHRATSGAALLLVLGLFIWVFRATPRRHPARLPAALSLLFILIEALIGAGLVLFELVADNASAARAVTISVHLANTFLLLAALTLTGIAALRGRPMRLTSPRSPSYALGAGMIVILLVGMSGAVTALGDTLFPAGSLAEGLRQDFNPQSHFLIRLRVIHPLMAIFSGLYLIFLAALLGNDINTQTRPSLKAILSGLVIIQLGAGALNIFLRAPIWLQLVHLLLADLIWVVLVLLAANQLDTDPVEIPEALEAQMRVEAVS